MQRLDKLWNDENPQFHTFQLPDAVRQQIVKLRTSIDRPYSVPVQNVVSNEQPKIPIGITLHDYQRAAIDAWRANDQCGIFEMATGSGKTFTALGAAVEELSSRGKLAIVILVPFIHLLDQWREDCEKFGLSPVLCGSSQTKWKAKLRSAVTDFRLTKSHLCVIAVHQTACSDSFIQAFVKVPCDQKMLIADEVHGLGARQLRHALQEEFRFWNQTIRTIRYYSKSAGSPGNVYVGGILATLMADELENELYPALNVKIIKGLLDQPGILDSDSRQIVEYMVPNYAILDEIDYQYTMADGYLGYATRGCVNRCRFCAVRTLEPQYKCGYHASVMDLVRSVDDLYGQKRDLLLLDNNILASPDFKQIIHEILDCGFEKGVRLNNRLRHLDFNQGIDARKLTVTKIKLLAKTAIDPLRLAFDHSRMRASYERAVRMACEYGLTRHSTYVLYNYTDTLEDFYGRLRINLELNEELGARISSFPMKYIPLNHKHRRHVGKHWHRQLIRGVQCILLATKGIVSPRREFFEAAFGADEHQFREICMMPEDYIIYRKNHLDLANEWRKLYHQIGSNQQQRLKEVLAGGKIKEAHCAQETGRLRKLMEHYLEP